ERRKRVYRKLFFSPGLHRKGQEDPDFLYIRNYRNRLAEDIEKHSDYQLHVFKNTAFLSIAEPKQHHQVYPNMKASTDLLLQLANELHNHIEAYVPNEHGEILLTEGEFEQIIEVLKEKYSDGWTKYFKEKTTSAIRIELVEALKEWMMAEVDEETLLLKI